MFLVLAVLVAAVGGAGTTVRGDQGAVQEDDFAALPADCGEGAVQAGCPGGKRGASAGSLVVFTRACTPARAIPASSGDLTRHQRPGHPLA
jgi:hypothetical protein